MGRFRQKHIIIKKCDEVDLIFVDRNRIYAHTKSPDKLYLFHKFSSPLGTYTNCWRPFRRRLLKLKNPSFIKICQIASNYNILSKGAVGDLDLNKKQVEIKYRAWSIKGETE